MPLPGMQNRKDGNHPGTATDTFTRMGLFLQTSDLFLNNNNSFAFLDANGKTMPAGEQKNRKLASKCYPGPAQYLEKAQKPAKCQ
jgi:hypothetical protein